MKKQIDGQLNLFDYISEEEKVVSSDSHNKSEKNKSNIKKINTKNSDNIISLYEKCSVCWCSTCRHNEKGQAIPRDFAGDKKPCPSCNFCIKQKKAEVCEIGSYENGCKLRAEEEGLTP